MEKIAIAGFGVVGTLYAADYLLGVRHDLNIANAGAKALEYMLAREAAGKASTCEPFITTARGPMADKEFLFFEDSYRATFKQVDEETNRLAQLLVASGVKPGSCVAVLFQNSPQAVMAQLAVMKVGAAVAFLNFNLRGAALLHTFKLGGARHLLFEDLNTDAVESIIADVDAGIKLISYGFKAAQPTGPLMGRDFIGIDASTLTRDFPDGTLDPGLELRKSIRLNSWAGIYYTSGTTGLPKAAYQVHNRLSSFPTTIAVGLNYFHQNDRIFVPLPLYHGSAQVSLNICCITGATYCFVRKFSASKFWDFARLSKATGVHHIGESARYVYAQPPSPRDRDHSVRKGIGNGLRADIWQGFMERFGITQMLEWFGASLSILELGLMTTTPNDLTDVFFLRSQEGAAGIFHIQSGRDGIGKIGRMGYLARRRGTIKLAKIDLVTEELIRDPKTGFVLEADWNEPGEILGMIVPAELSPVKASTYDGYYGDQKATEKKIARDVFSKGDAWMRMGDLIAMDRRGWLSFVDRLGETFRWHAENVSTTEVANTLQDFPALLEINVYGVQVPGQDGRAGMAAVTLRDDVDRSDANVAKVMKEFGKFAANALPGYAIPKFLRLMPEMEVTGTFKHRKVDYMKQGFDPRTIPERMYWHNPATNQYEPFGVQEFNNVVSGKAKL